MSNRCPRCQGEGFDITWAFGIGLKEGTPLSTEEAKRRCPCEHCDSKAFYTICTAAMLKVQDVLANDWLVMPAYIKRLSVYNEQGRRIQWAYHTLPEHVRQRLERLPRNQRKYNTNSVPSYTRRVPRTWLKL